MSGPDCVTEKHQEKSVPGFCKWPATVVGITSVRSSGERSSWETRLLEPMVNRFGLASTHLREAAEEVVDAFEEVSKHEREALKSFYLDGLTIAEIAARHQCPAGTVKRRLSHGRDHVRAVLGIKRKRRSAIMDARKPFPEQMPEVKIQRIGEDPFDLDFREMSWWFVLPEVGDEVRWASYEPPGSGQSPWKLSGTVEMSARRKAVIHLQEGGGDRSRAAFPQLCGRPRTTETRIRTRLVLPECGVGSQMTWSNGSQ